MAASALVTLSCATPHATLDITAPSAVTAGAPFTITVTTIYQGQQDTVTNNVLRFTSSDKAAILPHDYRFVPSDGGFRSFPNGVTLKTPGIQTITATMYMATGINGTATCKVSAPTSTGLE